jgi:hypothetical protein
MANAPVNRVSAEKFAGCRFEILNMLAAYGSVPLSIPTISVGNSPVRSSAVARVEPAPLATMRPAEHGAAMYKLSDKTQTPTSFPLNVNLPG